MWESKNKKSLSQSPYLSAFLYATSVVNLEWSSRYQSIHLCAPAPLISNRHFKILFGNLLTVTLLCKVLIVLLSSSTTVASGLKLFLYNYRFIVNRFSFFNFDCTIFSTRTSHGVILCSVYFKNNIIQNDLIKKFVGSILSVSPSIRLFEMPIRENCQHYLSLISKNKYWRFNIQFFY